MSGRVDSTGKVEAGIVRRISSTANLRFNAGYLNSNIDMA
tara:strand:+ start:121 stop:240 length:120 start_codon:yes stop_codon:yes gene_type:complete